MAEKDKDLDSTPAAGQTAVAKPKRSTKPKSKPPRLLPPWKVLLHDDDKNEVPFVVLTIMELTPLKQEEAVQRTLEAHQQKVSLLLVTHKDAQSSTRTSFNPRG